MRYLTTLLLLPLMGILTHVSAQADLIVNRINSPSENETLYINGYSPFQMQFKNIGDQSVMQGEQFTINMSVAGENLFDEDLTVTLSGNFAPGDSANVSTLVRMIPDPGQDGTYEVCMWLNYSGNVHTLCHDVELVYWPYELDVALENVRVADDTNVIERFVEYRGMFDLDNHGIEPVTQLPRFLYRFYLRVPDGGEQSLIPTTLLTFTDQLNIAPGERTTFNGPTFTLGENAPDTIDVCVRMDFGDINVNTAPADLCKRYQVVSPNTLSEVEIFADHINVYPNPASEVVNFTMTMQVGGDLSVQIFDLSGRMVSEEIRKGLEAGDQTITIESGTLESGTYLYRARSNGQQFEGKLIIR